MRCKDEIFADEMRHQAVVLNSLIERAESIIRLVSTGEKGVLMLVTAMEHLDSMRQVIQIHHPDSE